MVFQFLQLRAQTLSAHMVVSYPRNPKGLGPLRMPLPIIITWHSIKHIPHKHNPKRQTPSGIHISTRKPLSMPQITMPRLPRPPLLPTKHNNLLQLLPSNILPTLLLLAIALLHTKVRRVTWEAPNLEHSNTQATRLLRDLVQHTCPPMYQPIRTSRATGPVRTLSIKWIRRFLLLLPDCST